MEPSSPGQELETPIDPKVLANLQDLSKESPGFLEELVAIFLSDATGYLEQLQGAIKEQNKPVLMRMAHLLKGSCGNLGATEMAGLATRVEEFARLDQWEKIQNIYFQMQESFQRVKAYFAAQGDLSKC